MSVSVGVRRETRFSPGPVFFAASVFLGAFLIFLVQPMVGKRILPWFGGGPGVWTHCLMFYQCSLFVGYAYAHALISWVRPGLQWALHALILVLALALLPVLPGEAWRPGPLEDPSGAILGTLLANVALPFMALASTGPLLQAWFSRLYPDRSPYPLYAVSNIGSLAALLLFPSVIEPSLALERTGDFWSWAFVLSGASVLVCGLMTLARAAPASGNARASDAGGAPAAEPGALFLWLLLPACAVILLMAVTNKLCLDLASVPFLWVLPLGLYLVSFILTFGPQRSYRRSIYLPMAAAALFLQYLGQGGQTSSPSVLAPLGALPTQVLLFLVLLFSVCMLVHGELYRLRPAPRRLTAFYLAISLGGALGGLFVGLLAPRLFDSYHELYVALGASLLLLFWIFSRDVRSWIYWRGPRWRISAAALGTAGMLGFLWIASMSGTLTTVHSERNFFGILHVMNGRLGAVKNDFQNQDLEPSLQLLIHGTTLHGAQLLDDEGSKRPLSYYGLATGIGIALRQRVPDTAIHVGVVGLGTGALAGYGLEGDRFRFYEIDPGVIRIAGEDGYFSFLSDSAAEVDVIRGDARLSLQAELETRGGQGFDILVVDAFSSDSVPVHLLTREAVELYRKHLAPNGLIAFHASNRYLDLLPLIYAIAAEMDLHAITLQNGPMPFNLGHPARWIFLSAEATRLSSLPGAGRARMKQLGLNPRSLRYHSPKMGGYEKLPAWTDDYSSLIALLKIGG